MTSKDEQMMMTIRDVADYLNVHPSTVYRAIRNDNLPGFKIRKKWHFYRKDIDSWCAEKLWTTDRKQEEWKP